MIETRTLSPMELRKLCFKKKWYTRSTKGELDELLFLVKSCKNVTGANIENIAWVIFGHSDTDDDMPEICEAIAKICVSRFEYEPEAAG